MTLQEMKACGFVGSAKRLDNIDLPRIGKQIGVGEDELHAFLEVESRGSGFDDYNRPKILFEPHVFYRLLGPGPKRNLAVAKGLAYEKWGTKKYPLDSYPRLIQAMAIDPEKAIMACSWGMTQVMCENYKMLKYASPAAMVFAFMEDEENHVQGCVDFLIAKNLDDDLRRHDWTAVARGYNGSGYLKNQYHTKMAKAFAKWQKIPDTPYDNLRDYLVDKNDVIDPNSAITVDLSNGDSDDYEAPIIRNQKGKFAEQLLTKEEIKGIQVRFRNMGYIIKVDGIWGTEMKAAAIKLQATAGITEDGHYGAETREALNNPANKYKVSEARKNTTVEDLRAQGSRTIAATDSVKSTSKLAGVGLLTTGIISPVITYAPDAISWISPIREFFHSVPEYFWIILGLIVCYVLYTKAGKAEAARLDDEQTGKNIGHPDASPSPPLTVTDSKADTGSMPSFLKKKNNLEKDQKEQTEMVTE